MHKLTQALLAHPTKPTRRRTYSSKLLQRPQEITLPLLQGILNIILSDNLSPDFQALFVQRLMDRGVHVVLRRRH